MIWKPSIWLVTASCNESFLVYRYWRVLPPDPPQVDRVFSLTQHPLGAKQPLPCSPISIYVYIYMYICNPNIDPFFSVIYNQTTARVYKQARIFFFFLGFLIFSGGLYLICIFVSTREFVLLENKGGCVHK